ncbi:hypothetical protein J4460_02935 [Candidatus Woesearchaeota archaeon]|nr:hypothetical protein [Candidatus Woesearchaeota archaeon]HIH37689.1 hypothetical protein [Candidatus Woesearchaeota archaeon]HIH49061.1 hypothetical protein [Candidatus Woesearchaeota archaeon]HIJ02912.1 hypothetical protein [Candidatus Woesearchaeota archaeon]
MAANSCGMLICKKCGYVNVVAGILLILSALSTNAPAWFTPWTIVGLYLILWGAMSASGKQH